MYLSGFENDVKTYSIQTKEDEIKGQMEFENDVKTYSIQTPVDLRDAKSLFENDVKTYSIQTRLTQEIIYT